MATEDTQISAVDPHAAAMYDYLRGRYQPPFCYLRDDGKCSPDPIERRFEEPESFRDYERRLFDRVSGTALDIGCGAGKHLLPLQRAGIPVVGVEISPLAAQVCRERGAKRVHVGDALKMSYPDETFDSVLLFSNGLALGGSPEGVGRLLRECRRVTKPGGRILLTNTDVAQSTDPEDLAYQESNLARGFLPGRVRMRTSYRGQSSAEFDWLFMSPAEVEQSTVGTGWRLSDVDGAPWGGYAAVLERL
jgi:SAM-dependent methyltransferase